MDEVVSYKCPNCAAGLVFDIEKQNWHCSFCQGDFTLEKLKALEGQEDRPAQPQTAEDALGDVHWQQPDQAFGEDTAVFSCPSCGGRILTDQNTSATFCAFCHNPTVLSARLENEYKPAMLIPFKQERARMLEAVGQHCRKRPLLPRDFRRYAEQGEVTGLYVPFWLFDADVDATMSATARRTTTWRDNNYRYTKTDTYRVYRQGGISIRKLPADGSKKLDDRLMEALEPYNYDDMVEFTMQYLSGHFAENYDVDADAAAQRAFPRMRGAIEQLLRAEIKGYSSYVVNSLRSNIKNARNTYVMLPVWTLMAEYNGKQYTFAMNGQTGKIAGSLPIDKGRLWTLFGAIAGGVTLVSFLGGMLL